MTANLRPADNWASGAFYSRTIPDAPAHPTDFERLVRHVGLEKRPDLWRYNKRLVQFAETRRKTRYVPEHFLQELGMRVEVEL